MAAAAMALLAAGVGRANFAGTDVFIPSLGHGRGSAQSQWNACIWVHNPNAAPVNVTFRLLLRDQANPSAQVYNDTIQAGDTRRYDDASPPCRRHNQDLRRGAGDHPCRPGGPSSTRARIPRRPAAIRWTRWASSTPRSGLVRHRSPTENRAVGRLPDDAAGQLGVPLQLRLRGDHRQHGHGAGDGARRDRLDGGEQELHLGDIRRVSTTSPTFCRRSTRRTCGWK